MTLKEWYYLFVAALINLFFQYFWVKFYKKKLLKSPLELSLLFLSSFAIAWGIDVIQKELDIFSFVHIVKISLGCWLMFAVASGGRLYFIRGFSRRDIVIDFGGELIGYLLMGAVVYVLT